MAKAPTIYGFYYDTGRRTYEPTGPTSGVVTTYDARSFSSIDCLTVLGWHKQALEMCGATDIAAEEEAWDSAPAEWTDRLRSSAVR